MRVIGMGITISLMIYCNDDLRYIFSKTLIMGAFVSSDSSETTLAVSSSIEELLLSSVGILITSIRHGRLIWFFDKSDNCVVQALQLYRGLDLVLVRQSMASRIELLAVLRFISVP